MTLRPGTLYVVATPIGNLEDLTFRALRTLREVDLIAAEDTRRTAKLLARYEIRKPLVSVREHNEAGEAQRLIAKLAAGQNIALVSDAGTPGIADPGARLVRTARERGVAVVPIPGANAIAAALSVSGVEGEEFVFMGFPPPGGSNRRAWFERLAAESRVIVFFEAPHRIARTLAETDRLLVDRHIYVHRELTKINEELVVYTNEAPDRAINERGEFTIVIGTGAIGYDKSIGITAIVELFGRLTNNCAFTFDESIRITARMFGVSEPQVSKTIKKHRILVKQSKSPVA